MARAARSTWRMLPDTEGRYRTEVANLCQRLQCEDSRSTGDLAIDVRYLGRQLGDIVNAEKARQIGADFIDKNSESLSLDILNFLYRRLGFGNFVFKDPSGTPLMEARNLQEFEEMFRIVPDTALEYHGSRNSFSTWLTVNQPSPSRR